MATYTWDFPTFDTAPSEDGLSDVIKTIHYRYTAISDQTDSDGTPLHSHYIWHGVSNSRPQ